MRPSFSRKRGSSSRSQIRRPWRDILSSYAGPMPREVVPMRAAPRAASAAFSTWRCSGRMTCARLLMCRRPLTSMPACSSVSSSPISAFGSTTTPEPITARSPGRRMPHGISCRMKLLVIEDDRVAGVVSARVTRHIVERRGNVVHDLAFAFVAPLRAHDYNRLHPHKTFLAAIRSSRTFPGVQRILRKNFSGVTNYPTRRPARRQAAPPNPTDLRRVAGPSRPRLACGSRSSRRV